MENSIILTATVGVAVTTRDRARYLLQRTTLLTMVLRAKIFCLTLISLLSATDAFGIIGNKCHNAGTCFRRNEVSALKSSQSPPEEGSSEQIKDEGDECLPETTVRIDDGGSDLTDRFKHKVNALMGTYDPVGGPDDETQNGNILNAMLNFPVRYSFNVVGRTGGNDEARDSYVEEVKNLCMSLSGDKDGLQCQVTPRGKNFTKITV